MISKRMVLQELTHEDEGPQGSCHLGRGLGTTRPGRRPITDKEIGCTPCQADGPPPCLILSFVGASSNPRQGSLVAARPQGQSDAITSLTPWADMLISATRAFTPGDRVRDHIALVARQAGFTAQTEQNVWVQGRTLEGGEPAPGSVRPIHRADLHIIEPASSELWLNVRVHTVVVGLPVARVLLREEQTNCRAYGQRHGYDLCQLDRDVIPVVLEQYGRTAPGAHAIFQRLIHHRAQLLVRQGLAA